VAGRAVGRIGDRVLLGCILERADRRIGFDVPGDVAHPGEAAAEDPHRRALAERPHHADGADADPDVGGTGDHRLQRLPGALGAEVLQHEAVLLEDAGLLAEDRRLLRPRLHLSDRDFQRVVGARHVSTQQRAAERREDRHRGAVRQAKACHKACHKARHNSCRQSGHVCFPQASRCCLSACDVGVAHARTITG